MSFSHQFVWGAAAASFQIEGAAHADGKSLSVWDTFCEQPDKVTDGHTGEIACDHYHRYREDVAIMAQMGLQAYRFSIAWPRVLPDGTGKINAKGLGFYDRLVDELLAQGIAPWATLFHWDYPYELYKKGGWLNPDSSDWFAEYASTIMARLSDRVSHWMTLNEPQCFIHLGHQTGYHAPGLKLGLRDVLTVAHNSLLAHGKACQVIRQEGKTAAKIGAAPVGVIHVPASDSPADIDAARTATFAIRDKNTFNNTWYADPMILGHYPEDGLALFGQHVPRFNPGDMDIIRQPLDFYGTNIYTAGIARAKGQDFELLKNPVGAPLTAMDWLVNPSSLYWASKFYQERYGLPIILTENGMANLDWRLSDGTVQDPQRIDLLKRYLQQLKRAASEGIDIQGYFQWSIMDNFEWALGYSRRFGLVFVDYENQERILKSSAHWYKTVIASNGAVLDE